MTIEVTQENFDDEVLNSKIPVLVDFWAPWCGPCKMLGPLIDKMSRENQKVKFVKINIEECSQLAEQYNVASIPHMMMFKEGEQKNSLLGFNPEPKIKELIENV
jgi:thioredoxin 1